MIASQNLVSIIIPCYKAGLYISQALNSIAQQTYQAWEIVAVDDCGPEDGTEELIQNFAKQHSAHTVKFLKHDKNRGVSAARNTGIKNANGDFIALLDPDDFWTPEHLEQAINQFNQDKELYFYSSFAYLFNGDDASNILGVEGYKDWELRAFPSILAIRNAIPNSSAILRKEVFCEVGYYDTTIHMGEDCDLWIRIITQKLKTFINPQSTIFYRKHAYAATSNKIEIHEAKQALVLKHKDWLVLNWRRALDTQIRHLFWLEQQVKNEKEQRFQLEQRLKILEQTIAKFKSLPVLKQLLQFKKRLSGN